jgi:hypothetical protein
MHAQLFLHGVGSFCRIPHARITGELGVQGRNENICKVGQFIVKRCDHKELRSRLWVMDLPCLGSNLSRLLAVILISFRRFRTHF